MPKVGHLALVVANTIVGDNTAAAGNDLGGPLAFDVSFSLVESPAGATITDSGGNVLGQDAQLGPLANNGGPTQTHLPALASPAVDAGNPAFAPPPATDQRDLARVVNGRDRHGLGGARTSRAGHHPAHCRCGDGEAAGTVTVTATRTGGADGAVGVSIATADGSAVAPGDYTAVVAGLLSWADGDSAPKSLNITIVNDTADEPDETFTVTISAPTGGAALARPPQPRSPFWMTTFRCR